MTMLRILASFMAVVFLVSCATTGSKKFKLRKYKEVQLKNGMSVLLVQDKKLPSFSVVMMVKTGSASDPKGKKGLANLVGALIEKGTSNRSALEIADDLGQIGADFDVSVTKDFTIVSGSSLSFKKDQLIDIFTEMVATPSFKETELRRSKQQVLSSLKRTVDNPGSFASRAFSKFLFDDHPYSHNPDGKKGDVASIKRKDVIRFYKKYYRPNNAVLAIVGDFEQGIEKRFEEKLSGWGPRQIKSLNFSKVPAIQGRQITLVDKPGLAQSQILLGHFGIKRSNPDYLTLKVANSILGRGFSSRLMSEIRVKRGLTYHIGSHFSARADRGPFLISTFSRHDKVGETVSETLNVLQKFKEKGVTKEEVMAAKSYLKGIFPRILETAESTAENLLILRYYGVSDEYLETFLYKMDKVSVSDVNRVINKYFDPKNLKILVFSSKKKVMGQLKDVGTLQVKSYRESL